MTDAWFCRPARALVIRIVTRRELDDRLCDLAVDLAEPGGYEQLKAAGVRDSARRFVP